MTQEQLEKEAMNLLLAGEDKIFTALQLQYKHSKVRERVLTEWGLSTEFFVPDEYKFGSLHGKIDDVQAVLKNPDDTIIFILWVEDGKIGALEGMQLSDMEWRNDFSGSNIEYSFKNGRSFELKFL